MLKQCALPPPRIPYNRFHAWTLLGILAAAVFALACCRVQADVIAQTPQTLAIEIDVAQATLQRLQHELDVAIETARAEDPARVELLELQQQLAEQYTFDGKLLAELQAAEDQALALMEQGAEDDGGKILLATQQRYAQLLQTYRVLQQSIEADANAELVERGATMYFKMRVKAPIPPKVLNAFGLMEFARQERDQGRFNEALQAFAQAESMTREGIDDHIEIMREWRKNAEVEAANRKQRIKRDVEKILAEHFVAIPAGEFQMGSTQGAPDEQPRHKVSVPAFLLGKTEVTFELFDLCVESTQCFSRPDDQGWGRADRPVINVSHRDIHKRFLPWLNELTGRQYRLPTEAEWEYAARAGSDTEYSWGDNITCGMARFDGGPTSVCHAQARGEQGPAPVASFKPNKLGLFDMHGNVWEWVDDCWNAHYKSAPTDGSSWLEGSCNARVLRGGAWDYPGNGLRAANRYFAPYNARKPGVGFRLVLDTGSPPA